jgi:DNA modification methylase
LLGELGEIPGTDLSLTGFGENEIRDFLRSLAAREHRDRPESFDLDAALEEAARTPRVGCGEVWRLGDHRLACGDATRSEDVAAALGGRQADLAFTDPPYGVAYDGGPVPSHRRRLKAIANDALDPAAWETFCRSWARTLLAAVDGAIYVCMSAKEMPTVARVLLEEGGHLSDTIIWAKDRLTLGRADYQQSGYEPIWYGWREGATHHWCSDRDQGDVWTIARPSESPLNATMKPLPLMERAIDNSSLSGALVLDPFAGSGSTLIAAERTGRVCAAVELAARYCDVILARWEAFTGGQAERVDG